MEDQTKIAFKDSLKSWDTENLLDRVFYRRVGFQIALLLKPTKITPNAVTIFSIFVGVGACLLFYPDNQLWINLIGFALLVFANILDCVDGQLSRITGIKSEIGRILDGFCGDIWFLTFYTVITLRMMNSEEWGFLGYWTILFAVLSALSHFNQAGMVDMYKTFHLHMLKGGKNSEFESKVVIKARYDAMPWKDNRISKIFTKLYYFYTWNQEKSTPQLTRFNDRMNAEYPDGYPEDKIVAFRKKSLRMMPLLDSFTFNARSLVMLATLLLNIEWLYFAVEILILNPLLYIAINRHEKMCRELNNQ